MLADDLEKLQGEKQDHDTAKEAWDKLMQMVERDQSEVSAKVS